MPKLSKIADWYADQLIKDKFDIDIMRSIEGIKYGEAKARESILQRKMSNQQRQSNKSDQLGRELAYINPIDKGHIRLIEMLDKQEKNSR
jgi:hypothetical protein